MIADLTTEITERDRAVFLFELVLMTLLLWAFIGAMRLLVILWCALVVGCGEEEKEDEVGEEKMIRVSLVEDVPVCGLPISYYFKGTQVLEVGIIEGEAKLGRSGFYREKVSLEKGGDLEGFLKGDGRPRVLMIWAGKGERFRGVKKLMRIAVEAGIDRLHFVVKTGDGARHMSLEYRVPEWVLSGETNLGCHESVYLTPEGVFRSDESGGTKEVDLRGIEKRLRVYRAAAEVSGGEAMGPVLGVRDDVAYERFIELWKVYERVGGSAEIQLGD